jgi:hypothetical protein
MSVIRRFSRAGYPQDVRNFILSLWRRFSVAAKMGVTKAVSLPNEDSKIEAGGIAVCLRHTVVYSGA